MRHPFEKYIVIRDDYLKLPHDVIEISKHLKYQRAPYYPGKRTENLMAHKDSEVTKFAQWFSGELSYNVFPGIIDFELYLCFHINDPCNDPRYNYGWIHNDFGNLAGLIYLTEGEENIDTGTSIFTGEVIGEELPTDKDAREKFHFQGEITPEFVMGFERNQQFFADKETVRIGNKFNRLVGYDSQMWHRPNSYSTTIGQPRLSLLFFISRFTFVDN